MNGGAPQDAFLNLRRTVQAWRAAEQGQRPWERGALSRGKREADPRIAPGVAEVTPGWGSELGG